MKRKLPPLELIIWIVAMVVLYNLKFDEENGSSLCPIHYAGFDWCPGCGLGRAIHLFMHGQFKASIEKHYLGFIVLLVLLYRISTMTYQYLKFRK